MTTPQAGAEMTPLALQAGKYYHNGRGDLYGPMDERGTGVFLDQHGVLYHPDGRQWDHHPHSTGNLVAEAAERDADFREGMKLAYEFTQETQTVAEAVADLGRQIREARQARTAAEADRAIMQSALGDTEVKYAELQTTNVVLRELLKQAREYVVSPSFDEEGELTAAIDAARKP